MNGINPNQPVQEEKDPKKPKVKVTTRIKGFFKKTGQWIKTHPRVIWVSVETVLGLALIYYMNRNQKILAKQQNLNLRRLIEDFSKGKKLSQAEQAFLKNVIKKGGAVTSKEIAEIQKNKAMMEAIQLLLGKIKFVGIKGAMKSSKPTKMQIRQALAYLAHHKDFANFIRAKGIYKIHHDTLTGVPTGGVTGGTGGTGGTAYDRQVGRGKSGA